MNWIEEQAEINRCSAIVCLGDFFDKSELNSEEITAIGEIMWADMAHWFIVGNHEMGRNNLEHSSSHLFEMLPDGLVIDEPMAFDTHDTTIILLPYILESHRKPLKEYLTDKNFMGLGALKENVIILSHNDIAGIQMGKFLSTDGFSIEEIEENCSLFINGHLHNEADIGKNIINLGNITGQNFSEDAFKYGHRALLIDTNTKSVQKFENPYAMNFYKVDCTRMKESEMIETLNGLKYPAVATIRTSGSMIHSVNKQLSETSNIISHRVLVDANTTTNNVVDEIEQTSLDHISKFVEYALTNIGADELTKNEIERISK